MLLQMLRRKRVSMSTKAEATVAALYRVSKNGKAEILDGELRVIG